MKLTLAICLATLCLSTQGQTNKPPFPRDVWLGYLANSNNIVQLVTKIKDLDAAVAEQNKLSELQFEAGRISRTRLQQRAWDAGAKRDYEAQVIRKSIASLRLRQYELEKLYTMPVPPKPIQKLPVVEIVSPKHTKKP